jgi:hypothetical protein
LPHDNVSHEFVAASHGFPHDTVSHELGDWGVQALLR